MSIMPLPNNPGPGSSDPNLAGSSFWGGLQLPAGFEKLPEMAQWATIMGQFNLQQRKMDKEDMDKYFERERERAKEAQAMGLQSNIALGAIKSMYDIPRQIAQARQMYGPEAATAFGKQIQGLNAPTVPRYF